MKIYFVIYKDFNGFREVLKKKKFYDRADAEKYANELFDCGYAVKVQASAEY